MKIAVSIAALGFALAGCLPFPYLSSQAGRGEIVTPGRWEISPVWTRDAFRPAEFWNLLFSPAWPSNDRAPGTLPVLAAHEGGPPLLWAPLPAGLAALDPATGQIREEILESVPLRRTRAAVSDRILFLSPPPRLSSRAAPPRAWKAVSGLRHPRRFEALPSGVVALAAGELSMIAPDGTKEWGLVKTRGRMCGAWQAGDLVVVSFLDPESGYLTNAYARADGAFRWTFPARVAAVEEDAVVLGPKDGRFHVSDLSGETVAREEARGAVPGRACAHLPRAGRRRGGMIVCAGRSAAHTDRATFDRLLAFSRGGGAAWTCELPEPARLSPVHAGGLVYVVLGPRFSGVSDLGGAFGGLQAHDPDDGRILFRLDFPAGFLSFCADRERVVVWTRDGKLRAYRHSHRPQPAKGRSP